MNQEKARFNMIEQQVRTWQVLDPKVLDTLAAVPRESFTPQNYQALAFADIRIPLGHQQTMLPPREEGRILQAIDLKGDENILEIGTGSGFLTAMLAENSRFVTSIDIYPEFIELAAENLKKLNIENVELQVADASIGFDKHAPYDVIVISCGLEDLLDSYLKLLTEKGRIFAYLGKPPSIAACLITHADGKFHCEKLFETDAEPMINAPVKSSFVF